MTHIGRWKLVERNPPTSRPTSVPPGTVAGLDITADATGPGAVRDGAARYEPG